MILLDGKKVAADLREKMRQEVAYWGIEGVRRPVLVIYSVGDDPASKVYVRNKLRAAEEIGILTIHRTFEVGVSITELTDSIHADNANPAVDGIMVQLPLPYTSHAMAQYIISCIDVQKDVDGLGFESIGKLRAGEPMHTPCTAKGVMDLLKAYDIGVEGKNVTIIGRSNIVGKPLADLMMNSGATVTQCHSKTKDTDVHTSHSDIIVSAIGKPKCFNSEMLSGGANQVIIDVGINRDENGKLCGDFDFDNVKDKCAAITPVPGGIGPMTVAELMSNTLDSWRYSEQLF